MIRTHKIMNMELTKENFLSSKEVKSFMEWLTRCINDSFRHEYIVRKTRQGWRCSTIFNAYENYRWKFSLKRRGIQGETFEESAKILDELSGRLKKAVHEGNDENCKQACLEVLEWGGVLHGNEQKIEEIYRQKGGLAVYLNNAKEKLTTGKIEDPVSYKDVHMNSGFTKIYSLYIDDFVIYDSRVGAALGFLVRKCREHTGDIPQQLRFAYSEGRGDGKRNPDPAKDCFPLLNSYNHIENNLKANWLLKEVASRSRFSSLPPERQLRGLEAALFMIGYQVSTTTYWDECNVFYKLWEMQCCGEPIKRR